MNRDNATIREGMDVYASDGEKLGTVDHFEGDYMVVEKGFFFPSDHYIPIRAAIRIDADRVVLGVPGDTTMQQGWGQEPEELTTARDRGESIMGGPDRTLYEDPQPFEHFQDTQRTHIDAEDEIKIPVSAEELTATRRPVNRGEVDINKRVVEERQSIDVPVTEEEVEITRRPVNRDAESDETSFEEGTIDVPLCGQEVETGKRTRVREEIDISKREVPKNERVTETVRHEEVQFDDTGNVIEEDVNGDKT